jgi:Helix-turn-helix domain
MTTPRNNKGRASRKDAAPEPTTKADSKATSTTAQRERLLKRLSRGPLDSVEGYRLGFLHLPRRVMELRRAGHQIGMCWVHRYGPDGMPHRVGQYRLEAA